MLYVVACSAPAAEIQRQERPVRALPRELVGAFACSSEGWRSNLQLRVEGRFLESDVYTTRSGRWEALPPGPAPCQPWGSARFVAGTLTLDHQPATCKELGDPQTLPVVRRTFVLRTMDASGFTADGWVCRRIGP